MRNNMSNCGPRSQLCVSSPPFLVSPFFSFFLFSFLFSLSLCSAGFEGMRCRLCDGFSHNGIAKSSTHPPRILQIFSSAEVRVRLLPLPPPVLALERTLKRVRWWQFHSTLTQMHL